MMDFDKDIVKTITKKKGSVIASDKVLRYLEDRIRSLVSRESWQLVGSSHFILANYIDIDEYGHTISFPLAFL